jgi:cytochrome c-type biogenesis protein CcmE
MPYRDDARALEERKEALESELVEVKRQIRARKLPVLTAPRIPSPCDVPWTEMKGDDKVRLCAHCAKYVYNLSALTRDEAESLLTREPRLCVRFYQRADGTVLTSDCPIGARKRRIRRVKRAAPYTLLAAGVVALGMGTARVTEPIYATTVDQVVGGKVSGLVRAEGTLVHGSIEKGADDTHFLLRAKDAVLRVRYTSTVVPDTFRDVPGRDLGVIVEGELEDTGVFRASMVLAKVSQGYRMKSDPMDP